MQTQCQVTAAYTGDSTATVARKQLCGHIFSPATREHAMMKETFSVTEAEGQFGNPEKGKRPPLEAATKQQLVKNEKTLRML
jgi:hypothetical protein